MTELNCSVRSQGHTNEDGEYTMCGSDLQAFIDDVMPPPDLDTTAIAAEADTTLDGRRRNQNDGRGDVLSVGPRRDHAFVVQFSDDLIQRFLDEDGGAITSAILRLGVAGRHPHRLIEIVPLGQDFVEGWGTVGATANCAADADTSNHDADCLQAWEEPILAEERRHGRPRHERWHRRPVYYDREHQLVGWDVTEDVAAGYSAWLIRTRHPRLGIFYSREGAAALRESFRAPTLMLERDTDESLVWDDHDVWDGGRWRHRGPHHRRWWDAHFDDRRAGIAE